MDKKNPKTHDSLFKWLISAFTQEFFEHYFPDISIGEFEFLDKEFIRRYEALKESLKGDLFLAIEAKIDGSFQDIVIHIEHESKREEMSERVYEYSCYAWLLKKLPVWSIVVYSDDFIWRKPVSDKFCYAFDSKNKRQFHHFDVIKVKEEKSEVLINTHSLMLNLLALKADDRECEPDILMRKIYRTVEKMKDVLTHDHLLLIRQWTDAYKKIPEQELKKIREEAGMEMIETTITEHFINQGRRIGVAEGDLRGQLKMLESMLKKGILSPEQFEEMAAPLRSELEELLKEN